MADEKDLSANIPQEPEWIQEAYGTESPIPRKKGRTPGKSPRKKSTRTPPSKVIGRSPSTSTRKSYHFTEMGNKERMYELFGENIRHCSALGFVVWNGIKWVPDGVGLVSSYASETIKHIYEEAANVLLEASETDDENERKRLASFAELLTKWAKSSETLKMVNSMVGLLKSDQRIQVDVSLFDSNPYLFNFANCTVNVCTGEAYPHNRDDYLTIAVPFNYNPNAKAPVCMQFLNDIMLGREELVTFLQKAFGLCMTADVTEQVWFLLLGSGENGKSTLLEAVAYALGDYSTAIDPSTISVSKKDGSSASSDIARLRGMRMVRVSETEQGTRLASELIKRMTGGDKQTARFLYGRDFDFKYSHKLFVFTNHEPVVTESSHGFWRRVRKVPFDYTVPAEKKDKQLPTKLEKEVEGILAWMVEGAKKWKREGLEVPELVKQATQRYREEQDVLGTYIRDFCIVGEGKQVQSSVIYKAYAAWLTEEMGMRPISQPMFRREMEGRNFAYKMGTSGTDKGKRFFIGLTLPSASSIQNMPVVDPTIEASTLNGNGHTNGNHSLETLDAELSNIEGL
jgi:putative DNA primase/helicase